MKKLFLVLVISILTLAFLFAAKEDLKEADSDLTGKYYVSNGNLVVNKDMSGKDPKLNDSTLKVQGPESMNEGKENRPEMGFGNTSRLRLENKINFSKFNLTEEFDNSTNQTKLKIELSNGRNAEVKIMPETASERALEVLKTKCENNCTIELKEVGSGNDTKLAYEYQEESQVKVFGLFKAKMMVQAQVDAETGEVIQSGKPWWSFLASQEKSEEETESIEEIATENESLEEAE